MRKTTGIVIASALLLALSACAAPTGPTLDGGSPVDPASCAPIWPHGDLAADVTATGDFGVVPVGAKFPTPLVSEDETSSAVIDEGDGPVIAPDSFVSGSMTIFDAATGDLLTQTDGATIFPVDSTVSPFFSGAACVRVGSRVAAVGTAAALIGGTRAVQNNIDPEQTLVSVLDIDQAFIARAQGSDRPPQNGLPTVSRTDTGRPGLSFTNAAPPAELRIETLIAGNGTTVEDGDTVLVHYTGVEWATRKVFDSSWERGTPASFATSAVVPGFAQALIGQRVGSQVLASVPPASGYGDSPPQGSGITADSTLVFVIDILGVQTAS